MAVHIEVLGKGDSLEPEDKRFHVEEEIAHIVFTAADDAKPDLYGQDVSRESVSD